jgi:hypothetical protein
MSSVTAAIILGLFATCTLYAMNFYLPVPIGRAARRRGKGYFPWVFIGWLVGPIPIFLAYLALVHWRPILNEHKAHS